MDRPVDKGIDIVTLEMAFNMRTGEFALSGCDANPVVALGMLDYALSRVRRALAVNDMRQDAQQASLIVPGSAFRQ